MKNRRTTLIAFVLIAALCVGIGYAALTDTLTIGGHVHYGQNEVDKAVFFSAAEVVSYNPVSAGTSPDHDATITPVAGEFSANNVDELAIEVPVDNLYDPGDSITFKATVQFSTAYLSGSTAPNGVRVNPSVLDNDSLEYFDITCAWATGDTGIFPTDDTQDLIITITLKEAAYTQPSLECHFNIVYNVVVNA